MTDNGPDNLVLAHMREFRGLLDRMIERQETTNIRLQGVEGTLAFLVSNITLMQSRLDRVENRLDRIERRLGLIEVTP